MAKKNINLANMTASDAYSLILFALYKLKDVPEYSTLSEIAYILNYEDLIKFLKYFGGQTITIPTMRELKLAGKCLLLYQKVNIEGEDFSKAVIETGSNTDYHTAEIKEMYFKLCDVMSEYSLKVK